MRGSSEPGMHYGCQELREDSERILQGRSHPQLEQLYRVHLARCGDCQRYHHRLAAIYRNPGKLAPLDSFARDREFAAILARLRPPASRPKLGAARVAVALLSTAAAILALALLIPSFGARLFGPPTAAMLEGHAEFGDASYGDVHIPVRSKLGHQAQSFARVIGGSASLTDAEGRANTGDSLTVGTTLVTGAEPLQVAFVGRLTANFQPETIARWHSASPQLVEIGLLSGTLAVRYDRSPGDPVLQVRTPSALVRVVGTVFTVAVERDETTVSVLRGKVEVLELGSDRSLAAVEAGFRYDSADASYRELGRREVAAALPLLEQSALVVSISQDGELTFEESTREPGQIPTSWTVPGLSDDPAQRTIDRVLDPDATAPLQPAARGRSPSTASSERAFDPRPLSDDEQATRRLISRYAEVERERRAAVESRLERCRTLQAEPETRFRAARCLGDFMRDYGGEPEAVEGLLMLGTLRMDFAHDYQSATRNFEEFLRRAPKHPKAELARYKLVLAAIEAGYIDHAIQRARAYLHQYPDGEYVGRVLQRFPELKSEL